MPSADLFCGDDGFLHLEDDWRRGVGWWLVNDEGRSRLTVSDAMRLVHHGLGIEILVEAQELVWRLEASAEHEGPAHPLHAAIAGLQDELAAACAEHRSDPETSLRRLPMVATLTSRHTSAR